jgi:hypothetical protein
MPHFLKLPRGPTFGAVTFLITLTLTQRIWNGKQSVFKDFRGVFPATPPYMVGFAVRDPISAFVR